MVVIAGTILLAGLTAAFLFGRTWDVGEILGGAEQESNVWIGVIIGIIAIIVLAIIGIILYRRYAK